MALGVLNNLSAVYAENNLNNTNSSLQKVLQQLSSGSKINSGADDAAGLSLVNGLAANSAALTQSETNATEGVGLLQVADGALSQVTSLLNRAITLATEASNGTLDDSQEAAANQEYQSILSEFNSIGSTTTYNGNQVFTGSTLGVDIYTGDSSATGGSIDNLFFASLSASSLGDTGGTVKQSAAGEFIDLTGSTQPVAGGDTVAGALTFTTDNADGTQSTYTTSSTTLSALVDEINSQHIPGVAATLTTAGAVGDTGAAADDIGIQITNTNYNASFTGGDTIEDDTSGSTAGAGNVYNNNSSITTVSYQFATGGDNSVDLNGTDLLSAADAQTALKAINNAITSISAQDGYIGAQINTLNAVSNVMSTQQENVLSAQNAVQATDYAAATSNMSKYEVLTQTGISALAQANSVQQEVTKLLQ